MGRLKKINKRGDIPVTVLVLGVVAVCILAVFLFYTSDRNVKKEFSAVNIVENVKMIREKATLYQNLGYSQGQIDDFLDIINKDTERYYEVNDKKISVKYNLPR